jgi:uncharacterized glyoxalase superfamily protein PhnB
MFTGAATIFTVSDMGASLAHYRDQLGFAVTFEYGEPVSYACLCRDEVSLHLARPDVSKRPPGSGGICIFVDAVDDVHAELVARGAKVVKAPKDYDYGMRDFDVVDLDGNQLVFGQGIEHS